MAPGWTAGQQHAALGHPPLLLLRGPRQGAAWG